MAPCVRRGEDLWGFRYTQARCFVMFFFFFNSWDLFKKWKSFLPDLSFNLRIITNPFFFFFLASKQIFVFFLPLCFFNFKTGHQPESNGGHWWTHAGTGGGGRQSRIRNFFSFILMGIYFPAEGWWMSFAFWAQCFSERSGNASACCWQQRQRRTVRRRLACRRTKSSKQLQCFLFFWLFFFLANNHWRWAHWSPNIHLVLILLLSARFL